MRGILHGPVPMIKIHIRFVRPMYFPDEFMVLQSWLRQGKILASLTKTPADEAWFQTITRHTISSLAYLNGTRLVKITGVFPPWNRNNCGEKRDKERERKGESNTKKRDNSAKLESNDKTDKRDGWREFEQNAKSDPSFHRSRKGQGEGKNSERQNSTKWQDGFLRCMCALSFPQVFVSEVRQQVSGWHSTDVCGGGVKRARACWELEFSTCSGSGRICGPLKPMAAELTNSAPDGVNEGKAGVRCSSGDVCAMCVNKQVHMGQRHN